MVLHSPTGSSRDSHAKELYWQSVAGHTIPTKPFLVTADNYYH